MKKEKWFDKNKTKCLHIDKISFWHYTSAEEMTVQNIAFFKRVGKGQTEVQSRLEVVVDGYELSFEGEEADDIYNILHSQKELL